MPLSRIVLFFALAALAAPLLGCEEAATYPASKPAVVFPTRAELSRIPAKAPLPTVFGTKDVPVDEWTVESPPLPTDAPYDDPSPWGSLLRDLMKTRTATVSLSPAMRCAASEIGRFHLKNRALPVETLRRFILARCGGETPNLSPFVWFVDAPAAVSDEQIIARARDAIANAIEEPLARGHHLVGLAAARDAKRVSVVLAIGEDEARLEPGTRSIDANRRVTLRGTARGEFAHVIALVNRGDYGVSRCDGDPAVRPPRFAVTCELAAGDPFAWVEVLGEREGRVMLHPLVDALVYEGDGSSARYQAKSLGTPAPVDTLPAFTSALVDRVNGVRSAAKMAPLTLARKQSAENERLAGTILDAAVTQDDDATEKAAIGLLAGWDVEGGTIRNGGFFLGAVAPTRDAMVWLESAVQRPSARMTLLDPDARVIAVGPAIPAGMPGLGAAVTTYSLFESEDHAADEALFLARIKAARAALGLGAPVRIKTSDDVRKQAARARQEELTPLAALHEMLATASWDSGAPAYGYVLETNDLSKVDVPDVFLKSGQLRVVVAITHHRAPGAAWGQYVIFTLVPGAGDSRALQAARARTKNAL
jgi:hypothetical protein